MATTAELRARIEAFTKQLSEEFQEIPVSEDECWLAVVEDLATELGDAVATSLIASQSRDNVEKAEANCPKCGNPGQNRGGRERELLTRRGPAVILEPEFYCTCCRKSFFPDDAGDRR